jgi:hypothetical protein
MEATSATCCSNNMHILIHDLWPTLTMSDMHVCGMPTCIPPNNSSTHTRTYLPIYSPIRHPPSPPYTSIKSWFNPTCSRCRMSWFIGSLPSSTALT